MKTGEMVLHALQQGGSWAGVCSLAKFVGRSESSVRHACVRLARRQQVVSRIIPGTHGRKEWCIAALCVAKLNVATLTGVASPAFTPMAVKLSDATVRVVNEFIAANKTFSAHDITQAMRDQVNAGMLDLDKNEVGTVHVNGQEVARVEHTEVKAVVHDAFIAGLMSGYERKLTPNGLFFEYSPRAPAPAVSVSSGDYDGTPSL